MGKDAKYWVSRFGVFEGEDHSERAEEVLVGMGARAVPALIAALDDKKHGSQAAWILGRIGLPAANKALSALARVAKTGRGQPRDLWSARALGQMGQLDTLMAMATTRRLLPAVVVGLAMARPQSYASYELLLARKDKTLTKLITHELRPGMASYAPPAGTFELVAAAMGSPDVAIRKDAMLALTEFRGATAKKRAVALLRPHLADRDAEVRRLAVFELSRCKTAAKLVVPEIRALLRDRNALVRQFAKMALDRIGGR